MSAQTCDDNGTALPRTLPAEDCRILAETMRMRAVATQDPKARSYLLTLAGLMWRGVAAGGYDLLLRPEAAAGEGEPSEIETITWRRFFGERGMQ
ncbi:MAG: hypothetical protein KGK07_07270 [Chloroflexota bacterium]|nr:hypothetical protein [Chloroflexota bacterium]